MRAGLLPEWREARSPAAGHLLHAFANDGNRNGGGAALIGYAVGFSRRTIDWMWFSIFLGWAFKVILLRLGGMHLYRRALPFSSSVTTRSPRGENSRVTTAAL